MSFKSSQLRKVLSSCDPDHSSINVILKEMLMFQSHLFFKQSRSLWKDPLLLCLQKQLCPFLKQRLSLKFVLTSQSHQFLSFRFKLAGIVTVAIVIDLIPSIVVVHSV